MPQQIKQGSNVLKEEVPRKVKKNSALEMNTP
jgi:hypothetical protein